ncbi:hypothetical protein F3J28_20280 [Enterobacter sp. Ap-1006]|uniref:hypothetical protein n=1 Tax=Enterobacter sp. Ap-1006 TaxID=2608345 RepID=UPI001421B6B6|nr:hypothetical protein [Enterobacter sp. Ap-1006]NIF50098.1 hypothetical protein [Enterobacter sp. Ap-1006]
MLFNMFDDKYFGKVAYKVDDYTVVINKGSEDGITMHDRFKIVALGDEIIDPDTLESLGQLEIVKGMAKVSHIQEKVTTITSNDYETRPDKQEIVKKPSITWGLNTSETVKVTPGERTRKKLYRVDIGDFVIKL